MPLQQNRIRGFPFSAEPVFRSSPGPLWATLIHTLALTLQLQRTLSLFHHVLRQSRSPALPTSPKSCLSHNDDLDVNGLTYDDANNLDQ